MSRLRYFSHKICSLFDIETGLYYYRARYYNPYIGRFMQQDRVGYADGVNLYSYCKNNPLAYADHSGSFSFSPEYMGDAACLVWQDVRAYTEEQRDLAVARDITDVEALAQIADKVADWSEEQFLGSDLETLMFVRDLSELLCRRILGPTGIEDNPNQIGGFSDPNGHFGDSGFKPQYQESGSNQVDHFVAYLQSGYYGGYDAGIFYLLTQEPWDFDSPDILLGEHGVCVGARMRYNHAP